MGTPDQDTLLRAVEDARRILGNTLSRGSATLVRNRDAAPIRSGFLCCAIRGIMGYARDPYVREKFTREHGEARRVLEARGSPK
jgi:hypothetical protein